MKNREETYCKKCILISVIKHIDELFNRSLRHNFLLRTLTFILKRLVNGNLELVAFPHEGFLGLSEVGLFQVLKETSKKAVLLNERWFTQSTESHHQTSVVLAIVIMSCLALKSK